MAGSAMMDEPSGTAIMQQIATVIRQTVAEDWIEQFTIGPDSRFSQDLELESIEMARIIASLQQHFGPGVDLVGWLSGRSFDELVTLRIGDIATYVSDCLAQAS
jgi:acyl carrier protein